MKSGSQGNALAVAALAAAYTARSAVVVAGSRQLDCFCPAPRAASRYSATVGPSGTQST